MPALPQAAVRLRHGRTSPIRAPDRPLQGRVRAEPAMRSVHLRAAARRAEARAKAVLAEAAAAAGAQGAIPATRVA